MDKRRKIPEDYIAIIAELLNISYDTCAEGIARMERDKTVSLANLKSLTLVQEQPA
jgi:hypothetical protein